MGEDGAFRRLKLNLLLLLLSTLPATASGAESFDFPLLEGEVDFITGNVFADYDRYFLVPSYWTPTQGCFLELLLDYSPFLLVRKSTLTVALNNHPLTNFRFSDFRSEDVRLMVNLPVALLVEGVNHLRIEIYQRTTDEPCKDADNPTLWTILRKASKIHIEFERSREFRLSNFPLPLVEEVPGRYEVTFILPQSPSEDELRGALSIAVRLVQGSPYSTFAFEGLSQNDFVSKKSSHSHLVLVGKVEGLLPILNQLSESSLPILLAKGGKGLEVQNRDGQTIDPETGIVCLIPSPWNRRMTLVLVTGETDRAIARGVSILSDGDLTGQLPESYAFIDQDPLPAEEERPNRDENVITLSDLGYQDIPIQGVFDRSVRFFAPIPPRWEVKRGAYLQISLSHSPLLDPDKSAITVYIDEIPTASSKLDSSNVDDGIIRAKLPPLPPMTRFYNIRVALYLDVGQNDCSHRYAERAWAVIHKESFLYLPHTGMAPTKLDHYPEVLVRERDLGNVCFMLSPQPCSAEISAAVEVVSSLGKYSRGERVSLTVRTSPKLPPTERKLYDFILIGFPGSSTFREWENLFPIPVSEIDSSGGDTLRALPIVTEDAGVLESFLPPWNEERCGLVISGMSANALKRATEILLKRPSGLPLDGNVVLIGPHRQLLARNVILPESNPRRGLNLWFWLLPLMLLGIAYLFWVIRFKRSFGWKRGSK